jgi:hypothetical protein
MSKGPGSVMRKIDRLFSLDPEGVFSTADLCDEVYGLTIAFSKKQHVAVIRAAKAVAKNHPGIHCWKSERRGASRFWFHHDNVMSYSIARIRCSWPRVQQTNQNARKELLKPNNRNLIAPGGPWWLFVQQWIAQRDSNQKYLTELNPFRDQLEKEKQTEASWPVFLAFFRPH